MSGYVSNPDLLHEMLPYLAAGLSDPEIGAKMHLSREAVKSRNKGLYRLLGARNRHHAVGIAYERGLLRAANAQPSCRCGMG